MFTYFSRDSRDSLVASDREEKSVDVKKTTPPPPAAAKPKPMTASEIRQQLAGKTAGELVVFFSRVGGRDMVIYTTASVPDLINFFFLNFKGLKNSAVWRSKNL
jgi:hypothetical protein